MATRSGVWRACLSDLLLATGMLMLLGGALLWARSALAAQEVANRRYLVASVPLAVAMPNRASFTQLVASLPSPAPESPKKQIKLAEQQSPVGTETTMPPEISSTQDTLSTPDALSTQEVLTTPDVLTTPVAPEETGVAEEIELPPSNPVVHLEIPALKVKRAVVLVGLKPDRSGRMGWDTDAIFATNNRPDLVGHLVGSAYPGQGGNVILIGHNYNQVDYGWEGVFVDIKSLQPGDRIVIRGQDGHEYTYLVQLVKKVPWRSQNANELEKHMKYLGPVQSERLTLVTCGGANIWPFPARVYVIAVPEGN